MVAVDDETAYLGFGAVADLIVVVVVAAAVG